TVTLRGLALRDMTLGFLVNMSRGSWKNFTRNSSLWRYAFIYFVGEGAADKALQLNGSDMGGWTVDAEALPFPEEDDNFSIVYLVGKDAVDEAPKLSGTDMGGGHKVVVRFVAYHGRTIVHPRRHKGRIIRGRPREKRNMAEKEEDKKPKFVN
ncbi:hypothetical protein ARALYDRAFT_478232, partial [Arabidopsis lyrata subsp. lyrata]